MFALLYDVLLIGNTHKGISNLTSYTASYNSLNIKIKQCKEFYSLGEA